MRVHQLKKDKYSSILAFSGAQAFTFIMKLTSLVALTLAGLAAARPAAVPPGIPPEFVEKFPPSKGPCKPVKVEFSQVSDYNIVKITGLGLTKSVEFSRQLGNSFDHLMRDKIFGQQ